MEAVNVPDDTQRITMVGATGSGKTNAGLWNLSGRNWDRKPWVIYDFKEDSTINSIPNLRHIDSQDSIPDQPGLYAVHPYPGEDIEPQMWHIWERENTGVFVDEGLMIGRTNEAFRALLTQGRSKHIPMIVLSQRPVWLDRYVFSESDYFQVFRLNHRKDIESVQHMIPYSVYQRLPKYHSYYYDVNDNKMHVMRPVPDPDAVIDTFAVRMEGMPPRVL